MVLNQRVPQSAGNFLLITNFTHFFNVFIYFPSLVFSLLYAGQAYQAGTYTE